MAKRLTPIDKESEVYLNNVGTDFPEKENIVNCILKDIVDKINTISEDLDEVYRRLDELEA